MSKTTYRPEIPLNLKPLIKEIVKVNRGIKNQIHEYKMTLSESEDTYIELKISKAEITKTCNAGSLRKIESFIIGC